MTKYQVNKKLSNLQNTFFFVFFLFEPLLFSNLITFLFLIYFKRCKLLWEHHLKFYKSSWNFNSKIQHTRHFLGVWELAFVVFDGFFFDFLTPSTLGGCNFLNSIMFLTIFSAPHVPISRFKFFLDTRNNGAFPLDPAYPKLLSVLSLTNLPYSYN
jgi:hypothetical protein